jgi:hypothetical protein
MSTPAVTVIDFAAHGGRAREDHEAPCGAPARREDAPPGAQYIYKE